MGIYSETHFEIRCKNKEIAERVQKILEEKKDEHENTFGQGFELYTNEDGTNAVLAGFESSGRVQNLEYRITEMWEAIKDIEGVEELTAPFLIEGEGMFFSADEEVEVKLPTN